MMQIISNYQIDHPFQQIGIFYLRSFKQIILKKKQKDKDYTYQLWIQSLMLGDIQISILYNLD